MCFNPCAERRVPSPNRYIADAKFCFCKNNKRIIIIIQDLYVGAFPRLIRNIPIRCWQGGGGGCYIVKERCVSP
jgi:hypothetical protein